MTDAQIIAVRDAMRPIFERCATGLGKAAPWAGGLLLAHMAILCAAKAMNPTPRDASTLARIASEAVSHPPAPAEEAGRSSPEIGR